MPVSSTNLQYLLDDLRLHLGDYTFDSYRYTDLWLQTSLVASVKALMRRWNYKYLLDSDHDVYRNPNHVYIFPESDGIIQAGDERAVILMAAIIVKEGSLQASSWDFGSWKDAEISYSNIEGSKAKDKSILRDMEELDSTIKPATKRLAQPIKGTLPGYKDNPYEVSK